jgi:alcohol dehydrogenase
MKAAVLESFGTPLTVKDVPAPVAGTGEVIVDVIAAPVLSYASEVFSGERNYLLPAPVIPGCGAIGKVRTTGPDSARLQPGDWVFCDPTVRSRDNAVAPEIVLQGWSARGEGGSRIQKYHRDGPFAAQIRIPTENAIPIGDIEPDEAGKWCAINTLLIAYGGLLALKIRAGETLLVSGATGNFGSSAVLAAMAMGVGKIVAPGRNINVLRDLESRFGTRISTLVLTGDEEKDVKAMQRSAGQPVDAMLDFLPPSARASVVRNAIMSVRPYGRAVLMGGVGMQGGEDLALPYPWIMRNLMTIKGQWMYEPQAVPTLVGLIRSGLLNLDHYDVTEFALENVNEAVSHAYANGGPFRLTVVRP